MKKKKQPQNLPLKSVLLHSKYTGTAKTINHQLLLGFFSPIFLFGFNIESISLNSCINTQFGNSILSCYIIFYYKISMQHSWVSLNRVFSIFMYHISIMLVLYYFHVYTRSLSAFKHCSKSFPRAVESSHIPAKSTLARVLFLIESTSIPSLYKGNVSASITTQLNSTEHKYQYTTWGEHFLCSLFIYFYIYFFYKGF